MKQTLRQAFRYALLLTLFMRSNGSVWGQGTHQVSLGSAAQYGLLSASTITAQTNTTASPVQVLGRVGAGQGIGALVAATAGRFAQGSGTVLQALADLQQAQHQCASLGGPAATPLSGSLTGRSLSGGVYTSQGNVELSNNGVLTIAGDTNTVVIINVAGDLTLQANSQVVLNGVLPQHIVWNVSVIACTWPMAQPSSGWLC